MKNRLKELRTERGLLQKDVAAKLGVSAQSLGYYENWVNKPDPETLVKLADFYDVSIDYLLCRVNEFGERISEDFDSEERQLIALYRTLSPAQREAAKKTITLWRDAQKAKP